MKRKLEDMSISRRLLIAFGSILGILTVTVILAVAGFISIGNNFDNFYNQSYQITNMAQILQKDIQTVAKYIGYSMMEEDAAKTASYIGSAEEKLQEMRDGTAYMSENFIWDASLVTGYDTAMQNIMEDRDRVLELAAGNKKQEASELYFGKVMPGLLEANGYLKEIGEVASAKAEQSYQNAKSQKLFLTVVLLGIAAAAFAVTLYMARTIIAGITKPLDEMEHAASEMASGKLDVQISYESQDEMGSLARSMRTMTSNIRDIIEDIGRILGDLADGDFHTTSKILDHYVEDYVPILTAMRLIRDNLNSTLNDINESSRQVASGASQMAENAQGLAEGATEQAGAVEELTATVENVTSMAEESAEKAQSAYESILKSVEKAQTGKMEMNALIEAMERISETSKEIENIIASIEDIASQTNLLSLNASIEAARAGEAGKGFAVVADQIGKLASDSAQSAVNTRELIGKALEEIARGNSITVRTSESFRELIEDMQQFANVANGNSVTSSAQMQSLQQIADGIEQINSVVQSNSAAAEETSATSEELSAQAVSLEEQVGKFRLLEQTVS